MEMVCGLYYFPTDGWDVGPDTATTSLTKFSRGNTVYVTRFSRGNTVYESISV